MPKTRTLAEPQIRYLATVAAMQTLHAEVERQCPSPPRSADQTTLNAWIEKVSALEDRLGWFDIFHAQIDAKQALFAWVRLNLDEKEKRHPELAAQIKTVRELLDKLPEYPEIAEKVIDLSLRVNWSE